MAAETTSLAGTNYRSLDFAWGATVTPADGVYTAIDKMGRPPMEGDPEYDQIPVKYLGVDGVGMKLGGFNGRNILIDIIIIAASPTARETARNALIATMPVTSRFSVTIPGGTARPGCKLVQGGAQVKENFCISGKFCLSMTLNIRQMSLSN
jgi:hypothetical protein